jgi:hypothetical protein
LVIQQGGRMFMFQGKPRVVSNYHGWRRNSGSLAMFAASAAPNLVR